MADTADAPLQDAKVALIAADGAPANMEEATAITTHSKTLDRQSPEALHAQVASAFEAARGKPWMQQQVRVDHLSITAQLVVATDDDAAAAQELPTLWNTAKKALRRVRATKHAVTKHILRDVSAVFEPGTMTLILAQPGGGKSALMKAIAGRFPVTKNITVDGSITFNGKTQREIGARLPQIASYVPQRDNHFPTLTLKETLEFAHEFSAGGLPYNAEQLFANASPEVKQAAMDAGRALGEQYTDVAVQQYGLETCQNTIVGNAMLRGISGGERKRLTMSEMMFGDKNVLLMDEISTGLDSAAAFDIVKSQRSMADKFHKTVVMALLQPSPEIFELFDNVILLNRGHVVYNGPRDKVLEYFEGLGFHCPPQRDIADFLMDLGTHQQHQYEVDNAEGKIQPRRAREFADIFAASAIHQATLHALTEPVAQHLLDDNTEYFDHIPVFRHSFWQCTRTAMARQSMIMMRNRAFLRGRAMMVLIMGVLYSTVFGNINLKDAQVVMGVLFMSILFLAFGQAAQIPTFISAREIFYKQRGANFIRSASYTLSMSLSQIPMCVLETIVFGSLIYWVCGFVPTVQSFLVFEVVLFITVLCFGSYFFFLSSLIPNLHMAKPIGMVSVLFYNLFAGFIMSRGEIPSYFIWIYWIDPLSWGIRALAVSQYRDARFNVDVYGGVDYMKRFHKQMGVYTLGLFDVQSGKEWVWLGIVFCVCSYVMYLTLTCLVLEYKRYETPENITLDDEEVDETRGEMLSTSSDNSSVAYALVATPTSASKDEVIVPVVSAEREHHFVPVTLAFKDLWYTVPDPKNPKESLDLLKGVSGFALPGKITALMGSTGAGKTTLMDVIAGRKTGGTIRGEILLNGHPATDLAIRRSTGYCEQMDIHSEGSTIREALAFSAFLRQGSDISDEEKMASVEECLDLLDMHSIADQIIRGSSVEQMKRLTIGVEVAAQPSVLFLDEPTSGLDARSAKMIMDGVRKVADSGRTVVCTIHQPSWKVFQVFDSLLLLRMGGQTVFFGDLGKKASELVKYFEAVPGTHPIEKGMNPATWMLEVIGAGVGNMQGHDTDFTAIFNESDKCRAMQEKLEQEGVGRPSPNAPALTFKEKRAATEATQMKWLIKRFMDLYWRTPAYNLTRVVVSMILAVLFGCAFISVHYTTYQGINAGQGMVTMTTLFIGMVSFNSVLPIASEDRAAFYRERASQTYNALWYFVGSTVAEIPFVLVSTLLFLAVYFPLVGFSGVTRFLIYWAGLALHLLMQTYMGMLFVYALPSVEVAAILGVMFNSIFFLFMGFNPPSASLPHAYRWIHDISPPRYSLAIVSATVLADCPDPTSSYFACQQVSNLPPTVEQGMTVKQYVESVFEMKHDDIALNFAILAGITVFIRVLGLLALRFINHQKR